MTSHASSSEFAPESCPLLRLFRQVTAPDKRVLTFDTYRQGMGRW
jgi:hypothetical protein